MPDFDKNKAYAEQEEDVYFDDGREIELLHFVFNKPDLDDLRGSPEKVLAAIDEYGRTKKYLMNVGEDKGRIVTDLIAEVKPKVMVSTSPHAASCQGADIRRSSSAATSATRRSSSVTPSVAPAEIGCTASSATPSSQA
jgi:catechol O-methyltransferase